jgi:hypothetical protein
MIESMMKGHPLLKQELNKQKAQLNNKVRNKLQLSARNLLNECRKTLTSNDASDNDTYIAIGKLEAYVEIRESLLPEIQLDGYTNQIKGMIHKLKKEKSLK